MLTNLLWDFTGGFCFQSLKLGRHVAITKALREGILKVGAKRASKLDNESEHDEWFSSIGEAPNAELFRLYSKVSGRSFYGFQY